MQIAPETIRRWQPESFLVARPVPAEYFPLGVRFNGSTTILGAVPSGLANGRVGTLSFWFKVRGRTATSRRFFVSQSGNSYVSHENTDKIRIRWVSAAAATLYEYTSGATFAIDGLWHHVLASWNLNGSASAVYIDDASSGTPATFVTGTDIDYINASGAGFNYYIGGDITELRTVDCDIAEFYFNPTTAIDFSVTANRRKFLGPDGKPVYLGAHGEVPTGTAPIIFQSGAAQYWPTNRGTGGGWTMLDAPTVAQSDTTPQLILAQGVGPLALLTDPDTLYSPAITTTYSIGPALYSDPDTLYAPTVAGGAAVVNTPWTRWAAPLTLRKKRPESAIISTPQVPIPPQTVTLSLLADADTLYAPVVIGDKRINPYLHTNPSLFYAPYVEGGVEEAEEYYRAGVVRATVLRVKGRFIPPFSVNVVVRIEIGNIRLALLTDGDVLYPPTVQGAAVTQNVTLTLLTDPDTLYPPTLSATANVAPSFYADPDALYVPIVTATRNVTMALLTDPDNLYVPSVGWSVSLALLTDPDTLYVPAVGRGAANISHVKFTNINNLYAPTVAAAGAQNISLAKFTNTNNFYAPTVMAAAVQTIRPALFVDPDTLYSPHLTYPQILPSLPLLQDPDTLFAPRVQRRGFSGPTPPGYESQVGLWRSTGRAGRTGKRYRIYDVPED
jgi:hypothetical protein